MWINRIRFAALLSSFLIALETIAIMVIFSSPANAHEAPPTRIEISRIDLNRLAIEIEISPEVFLSKTKGIDHKEFETRPRAELLQMISDRPDLLVQSLEVNGPDGAIPLASKGMDADGRFALLALDAPSEDALSLTVTDTLGPSLVTVAEEGPGEFSTPRYLHPGEALHFGHAAAPNAPTGSVFVDYVIAGFDHILPKGLDHILFVIGLFLLTPKLRPLLFQVGLFTVAHTVTLALAATGWVSISPNIVEPLIAASIAFVAIENLFRSSLSRWRPWIVFGFGLLHGLGFAGVLSDFGLPADQFAIALIAFNIGVEIGQLTVLALCFAAVGLFFARPWYRRGIAMPASVVLAGFGVLWFVERVSGALA